jgi:hypothetical protein
VREYAKKYASEDYLKMFDLKSRTIIAKLEDHKRNAFPTTISFIGDGNEEHKK